MIVFTSDSSRFLAYSVRFSSVSLYLKADRFNESNIFFAPSSAGFKIFSATTIASTHGTAAAATEESPAMAAPAPSLAAASPAAPSPAAAISAAAAPSAAPDAASAAPDAADAADAADPDAAAPEEADDPPFPNAFMNLDRKSVPCFESYFPTPCLKRSVTSFTARFFTLSILL